MRFCIITCCAFLVSLVALSDNRITNDQFSRAEKAYRRSGPMAAAAVYLPDARKGKSEAAFYVGAMHVVEAAFQKKRGSHESAIMKLEDSALYWLRVAANGGNEEARALLQQVKKHGKAGLYFISLEHLFSGQPDPERDFGRYRWPNGPPKHH